MTIVITLPPSNNTSDFAHTDYFHMDLISYDNLQPQPDCSYNNNIADKWFPIINSDKCDLDFNEIHLTN